MHSQPISSSIYPTSLSPSPSPSSSPSLPALRRRVREVALRRGAWHPSEDARLLAIVAKYGAAHWRQIAVHIPGRNGKQARERWMNQLAPGVNRGGWSEDEDRAVVLLQGVHGTRWSLIAAEIEGRTDNGIKNRFNSTLKRKRDAGFYDAWLESAGYLRREVAEEKQVVAAKWAVQVAQGELTSPAKSMQAFGESPVRNHCNDAMPELKLDSLNLPIRTRDNLISPSENISARSGSEETVDSSLCVNRLSRHICPRPFFQPLSLSASYAPAPSQKYTRIRITDLLT